MMGIVNGPHKPSDAPLYLYHDIRGEGPPLILMHGLFGSYENLGRIARLLAPDFEVHSLDLRNHGRSPHADDMTYPLMAKDVIHYMDTKGITSGALFGHSMGGKTAMQIALTYPDRVRALVVEDIAPVTYPPHHQSILAGLKVISSKQITSRSQADKLLQTFVDELSVRQFLLKNLYRAESGCFKLRINLTSIEKHYNDLMQGQQGIPYSHSVMFIAGGNSNYIQPKHKEVVLSYFPKAKMRVIPGTDHWVHAQKPELCAQVARRYLLEHLSENENI
jgi:esterase